MRTFAYVFKYKPVQCFRACFADVGCPPSFVRYHGRCYRAVPGVVSFSTSGERDICTRMTWGETSYLARTDSLEVLNFIHMISLCVESVNIALFQS